MKLYTHPPPHPGLVFLYNLKLDVAGLGGYCRPGSLRRRRPCVLAGRGAGRWGAESGGSR